MMTGIEAHPLISDFDFFKNRERERQSERQREDREVQDYTSIDFLLSSKSAFSLFQRISGF